MSFKNTNTVPHGVKKVRKTAFVLFLWSLYLCNNDRSGFFLLACKQANRHSRNKTYSIKVANKTPREVVEFSISY